MNKNETTFKGKFEELSQSDKLRVLQEIERPYVEKEERIKNFIKGTAFSLFLEFRDGDYDIQANKEKIIEKNHNYIIDTIFAEADQMGIEKPEEYVDEIITKLKKEIKKYLS